MYGRNVFMGYLNDRPKTDEAIDAEGWLHSGDLGNIGEDGFIYITGRQKVIKPNISQNEKKKLKNFFNFRKY